MAALGVAVALCRELRSRRRAMRFDLDEVLSAPREQLRFVSNDDYVRMVGRREARRQRARENAIAAAVNRRADPGPGLTGDADGARATE